MVLQDLILNHCPSWNRHNSWCMEFRIVSPIVRFFVVNVYCLKCHSQWHVTPACFLRRLRSLSGHLDRKSVLSLKVQNLGYISNKKSYNKSRRDALILKFIFDKELYMFRTDLLSIIRSLNTVYPAIGICHVSYVVCLLARSGWNSFLYEMQTKLKASTNHAVAGSS